MPTKSSKPVHRATTAQHASTTADEVETPAAVVAEVEVAPEVLAGEAPPQAFVGLTRIAPDSAVS